MDKEQWAEIDRIFRECRELPVTDRDAFLARECADEEIRAEVTSLLAHHSEQFLETPLIKSTRTETFRRGLEPLDEHFEKDEVLNESPTSTIWLAREARSGRGVVLKQARRRSTETLGVLERQLPGQVKMLRVGSYEGCPAVVMDHSPGLPLCRHVQEHDLDDAARLNLFEKVCAVVQQTHGGAQVHGRLDPTHILVVDGDTNRVQILNSGIVTHQRDSLRAVFLELRGVIGDPSYMAPEQTRLDPPVQQTDVYALGCILFELLEERLPYELKTAHHGGTAEENARLICESEVPAGKPYSEALAKDPAERPRNAGAFLTALRG